MTYHAGALLLGTTSGCRHVEYMMVPNVHFSAQMRLVLVQSLLSLCCIPEYSMDRLSISRVEHSFHFPLEDQTFIHWERTTHIEPECNTNLRPDFSLEYTVYPPLNHDTLSLRRPLRPL